jgi:hypothetical protein
MDSATEAGDTRLTLISPETPKSFRRQLRISNRVIDVPVAEVGLDRACVLSIVGEFVAASVPQHVRMDPERHAREFAGTSNHLLDC